MLEFNGYACENMRNVDKELFIEYESRVNHRSKEGIQALIDLEEAGLIEIFVKDGEMYTYLSETAVKELSEFLDKKPDA